jgi:hypothetical protein
MKLKELIAPANRSARVADFLERAGWTAGQEFLSVLVTSTGGSTATGLPWKLALVMSAGAAIVSVLTTIVQYLGNLTNLSFWPDILTRTAKTFIASILGSAGASGLNILTFTWTTALNVAAVAALAAFAKGFLARGEPTSPDANAKGPAGGNPSTLKTSTYIDAVVRAEPSA